MNIRSITLGINLTHQSKKALEKDINSFMEIARKKYMNNGFDIRTHRLSLSPINEGTKFSSETTRSMVSWVSDLCEKVGIRWFCVPFMMVNSKNPILLTRNASEIVSRYKNVFVNMIVARNDVVNYESAKEASQLILTTSKMSNNGFDNFRVGVSINCEPNTPYFPFAYHEGDDGFSLALEIVDEFIMHATENINQGLGQVRKSILDYFIDNLSKIDAIGIDIENKTGVRYIGVDASLAPFPNGTTSVARLVEILGVEDFGSNGSLFVTSYLTDIIKTALAKSRVRYVGFNGVMYSLLEDDNLALRNRQKNFTLDSLILYSSVCGCGVDMVPIPGDVIYEEINSIILDVVALSTKLNKPLGVRLLPIVGKSANEPTDFNYDFLVDTRVMQTRNRGFLHY